MSQPPRLRLFSFTVDHGLLNYLTIPPPRLAFFHLPFSILLSPRSGHFSFTTDHGLFPLGGGNDADGHRQRRTLLGKETLNYYPNLHILKIEHNRFKNTHASIQKRAPLYHDVQLITKDYVSASPVETFLFYCGPWTIKLSNHSASPSVFSFTIFNSTGWRFSFLLPTMDFSPSGGNAKGVGLSNYTPLFSM